MVPIITQTASFRKITNIICLTNSSIDKGIPERLWPKVLMLVQYKALIPAQIQPWRPSYKVPLLVLTRLMVKGAKTVTSESFHQLWFITRTATNLFNSLMTMPPVFKTTANRSAHHLQEMYPKVNLGIWMTLLRLLLNRIRAERPRGTCPSNKRAANLWCRRKSRSHIRSNMTLTSEEWIIKNWDYMYLTLNFL